MQSRSRGYLTARFPAFRGSVLGLLALVAAPDVVFAECQYVDNTQSVPYAGGALREIPDIAAQELRDANSLISVRCFAEARELLDQYRAEHPEDHTANFIVARMLWLGGAPDQAEALLQATLGEHPDFSSAKVLLAALALETGAHDDADRWLNELQAESPDDLWGEIGRLKLRSSGMANAEVKARWMELLQNPGFPGSARETAALWLLRTQPLDEQETLQVYEAQLTFESATPYPMKAINFGRMLVERTKGQQARGRQVLETVLAEPAYRRHHQVARELLAESYLLEAAQIDPVPSPRNAHLVAKASDAVAGNLAALAPHVSQRGHFLAPLEPFLPGFEDPAFQDQQGHTALCRAVLRQQVEAVRVQAERSPDIDTLCGTTTALGHIIGINRGRVIDNRLEIVRILLEKGAEPRARANGGESILDRCSRSEECTADLLPALKNGDAMRTEPIWRRLKSLEERGLQPTVTSGR